MRGVGLGGRENVRRQRSAPSLADTPLLPSSATDSASAAGAGAGSDATGYGSAAAGSSAASVEPS